ncbi:PTS sugar transporter subunit IIC [Lactobacillus sp. ESL0731]|uniref:PTS sugar transporter subunit IIC n=1 Tax=unclassified Lactobacillus TaxID=2620435 RepID=UPI0023F8A393|nr:MULTISPECIES: PTS sugar transporter subunit IIC [unclassified Lactobacillus]WEV50510.1 PTS sugar transporter subunit IIC [Lactobacillus sp. ESL0700]WEV61640.1 PTS sugar transporter subunit IIC [Lactobacillus sp. ESL0731]
MKTVKQIVLDTLNGLSTGIVVALIPGALVNQLVKALVPTWPGLSFILALTAFAAGLLPAISAVCVGMTGKLTPIQTSSLALAATAGGGNFVMTNGKIAVNGSGDVINTAITIMIGYGLILLLGKKLKAYTILLVPLLVLVIAGGIGCLTKIPVGQLSTLIGVGVEHLTNLQPILMGIIMGIVFALLIVSPISSVGIATAINLVGIASGSANLGITAASFSLAIFGWQANSIGTSIAHFLGSPKMQMANLMTNPKLLVPVLINAGIAGGLGAICKIGGTPMSAGFGFSGLIGPLAAMAGRPANAANITLIVILFVVVPIALGLLMNYIFNHQLHYFTSKDFELDFS